MFSCWEVFHSPHGLCWQDVDAELSKMDQAKKNLKEYTDNLAEENEKVRPVVDAAMEHALKLKDQADFLDRQEEFLKHCLTFL